MSTTDKNSINEPLDDNALSEQLKQNNASANNSGDEDSNEEFPGYPHYPASEDIMNASSEDRVAVDVENIPKRGSQVSVDLTEGMPAKTGSAKDEPAAVGDMDDDILIVAGTEADVTDDDLALLEGDFGDGGTQLNRVKLDPIDDEIDELDVPGSEVDDANEEIGEEDEENNYYSLGGDAHDNLEEDQESTSREE